MTLNEFRRLTHQIEKVIEQRDALLAACERWVRYFDKLTEHDEPGDPLAELRTSFHKNRVEQTRAAIAKGGD